MTNETPESIAERIIKMSPREAEQAIQKNHYEYYYARVKQDIAEAIRKERVVRVPKYSRAKFSSLDSYFKNALHTIDEIKELNEGKTFVEGE